MDLHRTLAQGIDGVRRFTLTPLGLDAYLRSAVSDYAEMQERVCAAIVNGSEQGNDDALAATTGLPRLIVLHVLRLLASNLLVKVSPAGMNTMYYAISPKLHRMLEQARTTTRFGEHVVTISCPHTTRGTGATCTRGR